MFQPYERRDFPVETILENLKKREKQISLNKGAKYSLQEKLMEMGLSKEQLLILIKQKSEIK